MSSSLCCPRCGAALPASASPNAAAVLCPSCAGTTGPEASNPWWVDAAAPTPPVSPTAPPPLPNVVAAAPVRRRGRWYAAVAALLLLVAAGTFLLRPARRTGEANKARGVLAVAAEDRQVPRGSKAAPSLPLADMPAPPAPEPPRRRADLPASPRDGEAEALVSSEPPTLTAPTPQGKPIPVVKRDGPPPLHSLDMATEEELRQKTATAPEVGLGSTGPNVLNSYLSHVPANEIALGTAALTDAAPLLDVRPDLRMLPIRFGDTCKLNGKLTVSLDVLSRKLRAYLDRFTPEGPTGRSGSTEKLRTTLLTEMHGKKPEWLRPEAVPALLQILMGEETAYRRILVELLTKIDGPAATTALAQRAVFDLSPDVRESAIAALKDRPAALWRPVLLKAMRYPWAVPVQHAAEALVALHDTGSVEVLVSLLKLPDPAGPLTIHKNRHILQDVVRLNHLNNCMMCHPPAARANEPVLGVDPVVPLPIVLQTTSIMATSRQLTSGHGHGASAVSAPTTTTTTNAILLPLLIRGDITFLRQDFTVRLPVGTVSTGQNTRGVRRQRFDFVLRTRIVPRKLYAQMEEIVANRTSYPQRDAVLFALRELTGKDAGPTTEAWVQLYPHAESDVEAARISRQLLKTEGAEREILLAKCRDGDGEKHTKALAYAISGLRGVMKEHVRGVLIERMAHLPLDVLRQRLRDDDTELRRAALLACARKEDRKLIPDLIPLLDNGEPITSRLAEEGLASLTGEHFSSPTAWQGWWDKHGQASAK